MAASPRRGSLVVPKEGWQRPPWQRQGGAPGRPQVEAGSARTWISGLIPWTFSFFLLLQMKRPWAGLVGEQRRPQPRTASRCMCGRGSAEPPPGLTEQVSWALPTVFTERARPGGSCQVPQPDRGVYSSPPLSRTVKNHPAGQFRAEAAAARGCRGAEVAHILHPFSLKKRLPLSH